jgi:hypothetical protein
MIKEKTKELIGLIKRKWLDWIFFLIRRYFIAYISYFLFKTILEIDVIKIVYDFLKDYYRNDEKLYLTVYVSILFLVEAIVYFLLGVLVEIHINKWIRKNVDKAVQVKIFQEISDNLKQLTKFVVFKLNLISIQSLKELKMKGSEISFEDRTKIWMGSVNEIKQLLGFVVLAFLTALIEWNNLSTYWIVGVCFAIIILFCIIILVAIYVFIENLDKVFSFIESYAQTVVRYGEKQNQKIIK